MYHHNAGSGSSADISNGFPPASSRAQLRHDALLRPSVAVLQPQCAAAPRLCGVALQGHALLQLGEVRLASASVLRSVDVPARHDG